MSNKEKSNSKELTKEEILYQQLKLLAEESKHSSSEDLPQLTSAMCEVYTIMLIQDAIDNGIDLGKLSQQFYYMAKKTERKDGE